MSKSALESRFSLACTELQLPEPEREYMFAPPRRYKADFAWPFQRLIVEIEGGEFLNGYDKQGKPRRSRHTTGAGYTEDCKKYNFATLKGWRVLRFTGSMIMADPVGCAELVKKILESGRI